MSVVSNSLSPSSVGPGVAAMGSFVKKRLKDMPKHGQYRGKGTLIVTKDGVSIVGKHVHSLGKRWLYGVATWLFIAIVTLGAFVPGIVLIYPLVEYVWLKRGDRDISFGDILSVRFVPNKQLIGISFKGSPWESPAVLKSPDAKNVFAALSARLPGLSKVDE